MFSVTVFLGSGMWGLLYETEEKAAEAFAALQPTPIVYNDQTKGELSPTRILLCDDFGHQMIVHPESLHGAVLEDLNKSKLAHCERALHQQRTQIKAAQMSEADATIRSARQMAGPAIINPMGNGRMF